jgi:hypothetical protein
VIDPDEILTERLQYYIRAENERGDLVWHPSGGETAPLGVTVVDLRNMIYVETPAKTIGENEEFYIQVKLSNQRTAVTRIDSDDLRRGARRSTQAARPRRRWRSGPPSPATGRARTHTTDRQIAPPREPGGQVKRDAVILKAKFGRRRSPRPRRRPTCDARVHGARSESVRRGRADASPKSSGARRGSSAATAPGDHPRERPARADGHPHPAALEKSRPRTCSTPRTASSPPIAFEFLPSYTSFRRPVTMKLPFTTTEHGIQGSTDTTRLVSGTTTLARELVGGRVPGSKVAVDIATSSTSSCRIPARSPRRSTGSVHAQPLLPERQRLERRLALSFYLQQRAGHRAPLRRPRRDGAPAAEEGDVRQHQQNRSGTAPTTSARPSTGVYLYRLRGRRATR